MTNNPIPAALASIKRYGPTMILFDDGWKAGMSEKKNGEFYPVDDIAHLFATVPPPADGAVAWQGRYEDSVEGWGEWQHINARDVETYNRHERCQTRPLFAAPPADSAMVEALREASYKCDDMAQSLELVSTEGMSNFGKHKIAKSIELFKELGTLLAGREK